MAKHKLTSLAELTKKLALKALERREDRALSAIVEARDKKTAKTITHDDAWK